jgi:ubiquinone/menaquinone biosynthesis C-methylase UbiE
MFADPEKNIKQFGLKEGSAVADLGAGAGWHSYAAARAVGPSGKVYAVDIDKNMLNKVKDEAISQHLKNVEIIAGDLEKIGGSGLGDHSVGAVIASNIFFQIRNKDAFIKEINRILKPGGKALVIDWKDSSGGMGPSKKMIVKDETVRNYFEVHDFKAEKDIEAGEHHYGIIFRKADAKV